MNRAKQLARSTVLVLAGCALGSLAVGAVRSPGPPGTLRLGDIGLHRGQQDSLLFNYQGRIYRLRYMRWDSAQKEGVVNYTGTILADPWVEPERIKEKAETTRRGVVGPRIAPRSQRSQRAPEPVQPQARRSDR